MGTLIAWVLVRDEFRGKRAVNALIDLPFALPTIVAGLTLLALYGDAIAFKKEAVLLAMLFVTLPFVVRAVQPVLIELDREMEQAAYSLGASQLHHLQADRAAQPDAGDRVRRGAGVRPRGGRVRLDRADLGQQAVRHPGVLGVRLQAARVRQHHRRRGGVGGAARRCRSLVLVGLRFIEGRGGALDG